MQSAPVLSSVPCLPARDGRQAELSIGGHGRIRRASRQRARSAGARSPGRRVGFVPTQTVTACSTACQTVGMILIPLLDRGGH